jgi:hypothetical protein
MALSLYFISQSERDDYDTYDSAIVAAENPKEAKMIRPDRYTWENVKEETGYPSWATDLKNVKVKLIGFAKAGTKKGVILASFNAG